MNGPGAAPRKRRGRRPALPPWLMPPPPRPAVRLEPLAPADIQCLPHPDWLHQTVTFTGPTADVAALEAAAAGSGNVPWVYDYDSVEEHYFLLLMTQPRRTLSVAGAHILARQMRDVVMEGHEQAVSLVGVARHVPFDLQALVPVPLEILRRGPDDPASLRWLWEHWTTTWTLRRVERRVVAAAERAALQAGHAAFRVSFFSADWSPWGVLAQIRERWPALNVRLHATYLVD